MTSAGGAAAESAQWRAAPSSRTPCAARRVDEGALVAVVGQVDVEVQPGRHADGRRVRHVLGERTERGVPPAPVDGPHAAQMPGEVAGLDEGRQRELVERAGREVVVELLAPQVGHQPLGPGEPPDPQDRAQRLADAPAVHDAIRAQPLQRADRRAVVAELRVVVVLDDERVRRARPLRELDATLRRQHRAGRIGVRRRHEHARDVVLGARARGRRCRWRRRRPAPARARRSRSARGGS